ncbi:MAG: hypothetical protein QXT63_04020 [Thermoplasmata archaeon]
MSDRIKIKSTMKKEESKEEKKEDNKEEKREQEKKVESKNVDEGPKDEFEYAKRKRKTDIASMFEENLVEEPEEDRGISKVEYFEPATKVEQIEGKKIKIKSDKIEIKKTPHRYKITTQPGPVQDTKEEKSEFFKRYEKAVAEAQEEFERKKKEGKLGFPL